MVFTQYHALVAQLGHRLRAFGDAHIAQRLVEETRIDQVHGGMLDTASVDVYRHPVVVLSLIERPIVIIRAQVAQVIPGRAHESVHRVGFARGRAAAYRAFGVLPGRMEFQRTLAGRAPFNVIGQQHRQLVIGHGVPTVFFAIHHRDGRAPVTLTGDQPVAQAIVDGFLANAFFLDPVDGSRDRRVLASLFIVDWRAVDRAGVDDRPGTDVSSFLDGFLRIFLPFRLDDRDNGQLKFPGELVVALVMGRDRHDRARAVSHQHVVRNPDRDALVVDRVDGIAACEDAGLLFIGGFALNIRLPGGLFLVGCHFGLFIGSSDLVHERMLRREDHEGCAPERVRSSGEDLDFIPPLPPPARGGGI